MAEASKPPRAMMSVVTSGKDQGAEEEKKRISTGISALDSLIEGGLPEGKSYLIAGEPGSGKTIFCMRFILRSLGDGEKVVYIPVDEKPTEIVGNAASLGWDLKKYVTGGQLLMLDVALSQGAANKEVDVAKVVTDLASYVTRAGASRLVIDPAEPLISSPDSSKTSRQQARLLMRSLQDTMPGVTSLLTLNAPAHSGVGVDWEDYPVNGVILLGFRREQRRLVRTLLVNKMRGTAIDLVERQFSIVKDAGILIEATSPEAVAPRVPEAVAPRAPEAPSQPSETQKPQAEQIMFREWHG